jgi:hypothetical protein
LYFVRGSGTFLLGAGRDFVSGGGHIVRSAEVYLTSLSLRCMIQAERGFAAWAVFVGRTVVFVRGKGKGA